MKIPNYMYEPVYAPGSINLSTVARMLQIEAQGYRQVGRSREAQALERTAHCLKEIGRDKSPAQAFDWPTQAKSEVSDG